MKDCISSRSKPIFYQISMCIGVYYELSNSNNTVIICTFCLKSHVHNVRAFLCGKDLCAVRIELFQIMFQNWARHSSYIHVHSVGVN